MWNSGLLSIKFLCVTLRHMSITGRDKQGDAAMLQ